MPPRSLLPTWLAAALVLAAFVLSGLWSWRLQNRAAGAEQDAAIAQTEIRALEQDLEIERLLARRLAGDTVDLGQARLALLSSADAASAPAFAVIWSPSNGEGVLLHLGKTALPAGARFTLLATRTPASDRLDNDPVIDADAPPAFTRGLFTYRPEHPADVTAFTLRVTDTARPDQSRRFGGSLQP